MFKNVYYDAWKGKMHLWEIGENGETEYKIFDHEIEYYVLDKSGKSTITSIYGEPVVKRFARTKGSLKELKESGERLFESDLSETYKFLQKRYGNKDHKVNVKDYAIFNVDIENEFPDSETINLIGIEDYHTGEVFQLGLKPYTGENKDIRYIHCETESILLERFCKFLKLKKVSIVYGWNCAAFDFPKIQDRIDALQLKCSMSPIGKVIRKFDNTVEIAGIDILDSMELYKKFTFKNQPSFSLNYIGQLEVNDQKISYDGSILDFWKSDWNAFCDYNFQDLKLVTKIDMKKKFIPLAIAMGTDSRIPFSDVTSPIAITEGDALRYMHDNNMVMEDITHNIAYEKTRSIVGGHVESYPGFYNNCATWDATSEYPHNIMMYNISKETKVLNPSEEEIPNLIKSHIPGVYYKKTFGILPSITKKTFEERKQLKSKMFESKKAHDVDLAEYYDSQQLIRKIKINCFHPNTDVITCNGIKNIKDINVGDFVYSINPITKNLEKKEVTHTFIEYFDGNLKTFKSSRMKLRVTPDHNMIRLCKSSEEIQFITADKLSKLFEITIPIHNKISQTLESHIYLNEWVDNINDYWFIIEKNIDTRLCKNELNLIGLSHLDVVVMGCTRRFKYITNILNRDEIDILENNGYTVYVKNKRDYKTVKQLVKIDLNVFSEFVGWYLAEGSLYKSTLKKYETTTRGICKKITIAQYKDVNPNYYDFIVTCISKITNKFGSGNKYISIVSDLLYDVIEQNFGSKFNKQIFKTSLGSKLNYSKLHESMYFGDGNKEKYRYTITTKNRQFLDDFVQLQLFLGYCPRVTIDSNTYRITHRKLSCLTKHNVSDEKYTGDVYCLTVKDNHTLLAGENGTFAWTSQCIFGATANPYFHLYDFDNASQITAAGRDVIQYVGRSLNKFFLDDFWKLANEYYPNYDGTYVKTKNNLITIIDTDSNGLSLDHLYKNLAPEKSFLEFMLDFEKRIVEPFLKKIMDEYAVKYNTTNLLHFKREKIIEKMYVQAKKKYACLSIANEEEIFEYPGKLSVTGIETKKSDLCKFSRDNLDKFLKLVFEGETPDRLNLLNFIRKSHTEFKKQDITSIAIPKGIGNYERYDKDISNDLNNYISRTPIFNRASMIYNLVVKQNNLPYIDIKSGTKMKYIFVNPKNIYKTDVVGFIGNWPKEFDKFFKVDYDTQFEKQYLNIAQRIFDTLDFGTITLKDSKLSKLLEE